MVTKRSRAQLKREINDELISSGNAKYMLVDNRTGKDMRVAHDFEVKQIQGKRGGVGILELGGGWNTPAKHYEVRLRDLNAPKGRGRARGDIRIPEGTTIKARHFYLGTIDGGKLHYDTGRESFRTLDAALKRAKAYRRGPGAVIIEDLDLAKAGVVYGRRSILHSVIDGDILEGHGF